MIALIILQGVFLVVFNVILGICSASYAEYSLLFTEFMILTGLLYSYIKLVHLLKEFHIERYLEVISQLRFFMLTEIIPLVLDIVIRVIKILHDNTSLISDEVYNFVEHIDQYVDVFVD